MLLYVFIFCSRTLNAHLILNIPQVWGIDDGVALEQPLDINTLNPICAGKTPENNGVFNFIAGQTYELPITCGEKDINEPGCLIGDWHNGNSGTDYPGCALAISYNGIDSQSNFKYLSYSSDCAKINASTSFMISANIENCDQCICSWSLAPSRLHSSPGQFYHNCFYCSISGGVINPTMRMLDFMNIRNTVLHDLTYNDIVPVNIYLLEQPEYTSSTQTLYTQTLYTQTLYTQTLYTQTLYTQPTYTQTLYTPDATQSYYTKTLSQSCKNT